MKDLIRHLVADNPIKEKETSREYADRLEALCDYKWKASAIRKKYFTWKSKQETVEYQEEHGIATDKKEPVFDYRELLEHALKSQQIYGDANAAQSEAKFYIKTKDPIYVMFWGDQHIGATGMDIKGFRAITEELLNTPNLYVILLGDLMEMAIKMRSVHEVLGNMIPTKWQWKICEAWLDEIKHKVICATWDNHVIMREENVLGWSPTADMLSKKVIYHSGIGHIDVIVNDVQYKFAVSHFFRGNSIFNPNHELGRYIRNEYCEADLVAQGDKHTPAVQQLYISGRQRTLIKCGTHNTNSSYAKRFYSVKTFDDMPVVRLDQHTKEITPFMNIRAAKIWKDEVR